MTSSHKLLSTLTFLLLPTTAASKCERLSSLTYKQSDAPTDVSAILSLIQNKINSDVTNVVGIDVQWNGSEIHRRVGERVILSSVQRLVEDGGEEEPSRVVECFEVPFTILDVDECSESGEWRHECRGNSVCVNTEGSYECVCPLLEGGIGMRSVDVDTTAKRRVGAEEDASFWETIRRQSRSAWELSYASSSKTSCPNQSSTYQCCDFDGHSAEGAKCRSSFVCPVDSCKNHDCADDASCERATSPDSHPNYSCKCPVGTLGNGKTCKKQKSKVPNVKFDGVTPTEETALLLSRGLICGCQVPVVDICSGFKCDGKHEACTVGPDNSPICACKPGYIQHPDYGCVDEHPPLLHIRPYPGHSSTQEDASLTRLIQGDKYEEHGVDIVDDNAEEYLRSLKIEYSRPLPRGCLLEMGQFKVNYTVATPWTTPDHASAQRTVVIENVNECAIRKNVGVGKACPELVAMCDVESGAQCVDEIGTYTCKCPMGTEGDGFLPIARLRATEGGGYSGILVPRNYGGGTGCKDTSKPVIELIGPNPKKLSVTKVGRLDGDYKYREEDGEMSAKIESVRAERRSYYENEIRFMIKESAGAELCATRSNPNARPTDCVRATDHTYKGVVDLSSKVTVGEPTPKDGFPLQWRVPYNVVDAAGNKAQTVWRDVIVEEVDLHEFEKKTRVSVLEHRKDEVEHAVQKAVAEERRRTAASGSKNSGACPKCEVCDCSNRGSGNSAGGLSDAECEKRVAAALVSARGGSEKTCTFGSISTLSRHPWILMVLDWADELIGPDVAIMLLVGFVVPVMLYIFWRIIYAFFFSNGSDVRTYYHSIEDEEKEKRMAQNVTYYPSPSSTRVNQSITTTPGSTTSNDGVRRPPTASLSSQRNGVFSPQEQHRVNGGTLEQQNRQAQTSTSPFRTEDGTDSIYQTKSPITPSRNNTPTPSSRSYNLRSHH